MKRLFLAPRSNETAYRNYQSSMQGKSFEDIAPYLTPTEARSIRGKNTYFVWGCQPKLKGRWDKMRPGDFVLFYAQGRFISVGRVLFKKQSEDLALSLWPKSRTSGEAWSCVFLVDDVQPIDFSLKEFNAVTGYELTSVQGFMPVSSEEAFSNIILHYGSIDNFIQSLTVNLDDHSLSAIAALSAKLPAEITAEDKAKLDDLSRNSTPEEIERALRLYSERQKDKTPEQIVKMVKSYKRNVSIVIALKEKYQNKCQICGFTFKTSAGTFYSEAAHIIPISAASKGVDSPDNIWILCANHHKMLDRHAIEAVDRSTYSLNGVQHKLKEP